MERFWRTLRQGVLDHLERSLSLSKVQQRLDTFLSRHYHSQPHSSLFGDSPGIVWEARQTHAVPEQALRQALTLSATRRVSKDGVVRIDGQLFELRQGFLAGRLVTVSHCLVEGLAPEAFVEHDGRRYALRPLDTRLNGATRRPPRRKPSAPSSSTSFDPNAPSLSEETPHV